MNHAENPMLVNDGPHPRAADKVHERVLSFLAQEKPGLLLDIPAGEGAFAFHAKRLGWQAQCADLEFSTLKSSEGTALVMDMNQTWPFLDGHFDCLVSIEGIEHIENPWHMLREANRVLKPGGKLLLTTPNILSLKSRVSTLLYGYPNYFFYMVERDQWGSELTVDHINPVGFLELRHVLARSGFRFEIIETNRYQKRYSLFYQLLKFLVHTRGRRHCKTDGAKAKVRQILLSPALLFGEILVCKCEKIRSTEITNLSEVLP